MPWPLFKAGWAPGPVWTGAENLAHTGIRSPEGPAHSQLLYQLSYLAYACIMALLLLNTTGYNTLHAAVFLQHKEWKRILQYTLTNIHRVPKHHRIFIVAVMWCFERELTHDIHSTQDQCVVKYCLILI
jgi:hypothetical protein